jgi:hypothetical protein
MTTADRVVDVSQDWFQACSVQEGFMRGADALRFSRLTVADPSAANSR